MTPLSAALRSLALWGAALALSGCANLILDPDQVTPAPPREAAALSILQQPALQGVAGQNLGNPVLRVELLDADGARLTWDNETQLSIAPVAPSSGEALLQPLFGTLTATVVGGTAAFDDFSVRRAGRLRIAAYAGDSLSSATLVATSDDIAVAPAAKTRLAIDSQPTGGMAGPTAVGVVRVEILDELGNRTHDAEPITVVAWDDSLDEPAATSLTGTTTVSAVDGLAQLNDLGLTETGPFRIKATAVGLEDVVSEPFTVLPGAPAKLAFAGAPKALVKAFEDLGSFDVEVTDAWGHVTPAGTFVVRLRAVPESGSGATKAQPTGTTAVVTTGGVATFSALTYPVENETTDLLRESIRLLAYDGDNPAESVLALASSNEVVVVPDVATTLVITAPPVAAASVASDFAASSPVRVAARDAHNNLAAFNDDVTVTAYDAAGVSPASTVFGGTPTVTAVDGVAVLDHLTYRRAECITLKATAGGLTPAVSGELCLSVDTASIHPAFTAAPTSGVACQDLPDVAVSGQDQYGNPASTTIQLFAVDASVDSPAGATITGTTTAATTGGVATFQGLRYSLAECIRLKAVTPGSGSAFSSSFCVAPGAQARLVVATNPGGGPFATGENLVAASSNDFLVNILDACGNLVTGDSSTVVELGPVDPSTYVAVGTHFCVGGSCNEGDAHATASSGVARFTEFRFQSDDTVRIAAYVGTLAASTLTVGYSRTIRFAPAVGTIQFVAQPQDGQAQENFCDGGKDVVVQVLDGGGNPIAGIVVALLAWKSATDEPAAGAFARSLAAMQAGGESVVATTDASGTTTFSSLYYSTAETLRLKAVVDYTATSYEQLSVTFMLN